MADDSSSAMNVDEVHHMPPVAVVANSTTVNVNGADSVTSISFASSPLPTHTVSSFAASSASTSSFLPSSASSSASASSSSSSSFSASMSSSSSYSSSYSSSSKSLPSAATPTNSDSHTFANAENSLSVSVAVPTPSALGASAVKSGDSAVAVDEFDSSEHVDGEDGSIYDGVGGETVGTGVGDGFRSRQRRSHKQIVEDDDDGYGYADDSMEKNLTGVNANDQTPDFSNSATPAISAAFTFSKLIDKQQEDVLRKYYGRLFPCSAMYRWLSYGDSDFGSRREWSFTLSGDIYVRYLAFSNKEQLKADLVRRAPIKIDIGAVYNAAPTLNKQVAKFAPVAREFVIDIDMSDYNDIRRCCSESQVCDRCWPLMTAAIKVLDAILTEEFGFQHVLWVYSGRRGVHGWICDERARLLSNELRSALVDYLSLYVGGNEHSNKYAKIVNLAYPLHPRIQRVVTILRPYFEVLMRTEGWFSSKKDARNLLQFLDANYRKDFNWKFEDELRANTNINGGDADDDSVDPMSVEGVHVWAEFVERLGHLAFKYNKPGKQADTRAVRLCEFRVLLTHTYPRLDVNVSKQLNHLLKAPFCVHPKTGKICVPIDVKNAENFRADSVPCVEDLLAQLDSVGAVPRAWQRTSLRSHLEYFNAFIKRMSQDEKDKLSKQHAGKQEEREEKEQQEEQQTPHMAW